MFPDGGLPPDLYDVLSDPTPIVTVHYFLFPLTFFDTFIRIFKHTLKKRLLSDFCAACGKLNIYYQLQGEEHHS